MHLSYEYLIWFGSELKVFDPYWNCANEMLLNTIGDTGWSLYITFVAYECESWYEWMSLYDNICWSFYTSMCCDEVTGFEMMKYKLKINQINFKVKCI